MHEYAYIMHIFLSDIKIGAGQDATTRFEPSSILSTQDAFLEPSVLKPSINPVLFTNP